MKLAHLQKKVITAEGRRWSKESTDLINDNSNKNNRKMNSKHSKHNKNNKHRNHNKNNKSGPC